MMCVPVMQYTSVIVPLNIPATTLAVLCQPASKHKGRIDRWIDGQNYELVNRWVGRQMDGDGFMD